MSKAQRDKGRRGELELAALLPGGRRANDEGLPGPDVWFGGVRRWVEVKRRKELAVYKWLRDAPILAMRADRRPWLVVMELDELLDLLDEVATTVGSVRWKEAVRGAGTGPEPSGPPGTSQGR